MWEFLGDLVKLETKLIVRVDVAKFLTGKSREISYHQHHGNILISTFLLFSTYPCFFQLILTLFITNGSDFSPPLACNLYKSET